jgi:glutamate-1-semialdehyde 2,1-aminomutase
MKSIRSEDLFAQARQVFPGGVNSPVRSFRSVGGRPFVAVRGSGPFIVDADGNELIDLVGSWGALIHGHSHPDIEAAIHSATKDGTSFGITSEREIRLGQKMKALLPSADLIRLVNSGTEACMSAIRLARGFTNREIIIKFEGTYHGHGDSFLVAAGSGLTAQSSPDSAGIPSNTLANTVVLPFNNLSALKQAFEKYGEKIAGVMLEVVCGNMGVVLPEYDFLNSLRSLCTQHKSVLIFDEVMTGFRLAMGGAQEIYGISPDLTCYGKIIGGGLPVGAYAGRKEIMEMVAPLGSVYQAGTLSGNPLGAAAGLASLELIENDRKHFYQKLDYHSNEWADALNAHIESKSYPVCVARAGSMFTVFFTSEAPTNFVEAKKCDLERFKKFFWSLLHQGVYYPPSQFEACFLSARHDSDIMSRVIEASCRALDEAYAK